MDYFAILIAAIGGALGGGLGVLIGSKFKNKNVKMIATVVPVVVLAQIFPSIAKSLNLKDLIFPPSRFELLVRKGTEKYRDVPTLNKALKGMNDSEANAFMQQKTKLGLKRLAFDDLKTWNSIRTKMAQANSTMCASFWTGKGITVDLVQQTMVDLGEKDAMDFIRTSMKAAILELDQSSYEAPPPETLQNTIKGVSASLKKEEAERFGAVLIAGLNANNDDACWAMMIMLKSSESLKDPEREHFLRALAAL